MRAEIFSQQLPSKLNRRAMRQIVVSLAKVVWLLTSVLVCNPTWVYNIYSRCQLAFILFCNRQPKRTCRHVGSKYCLARVGDSHRVFWKRWVYYSGGFKSNHSRGGSSVERNRAIHLNATPLRWAIGIYYGGVLVNDDIDLDIAIHVLHWQTMIFRRNLFTNAKQQQTESQKMIIDQVVDVAEHVDDESSNKRMIELERNALQCAYCVVSAPILLYMAFARLCRPHRVWHLCVARLVKNQKQSNLQYSMCRFARIFWSSNNR